MVTRHSNRVRRNFCRPQQRSKAAKLEKRPSFHLQRSYILVTLDVLREPGICLPRSNGHQALAFPLRWFYAFRRATNVDKMSLANYLLSQFSGIKNFGCVEHSHSKYVVTWGIFMARNWCRMKTKNVTGLFVSLKNCAWSWRAPTMRFLIN